LANAITLEEVSVYVLHQRNTNVQPIRLHEKDAILKKILWHEDPIDEVQAYSLPISMSNMLYANFELRCRFMIELFFV